MFANMITQREELGCSFCTDQNAANGQKSPEGIGGGVRLSTA